MSAYDYDRQEWVTGLDGARLMKEQATANLARFRNMSRAEAQKELDCTGAQITVAEFIAGMVRRIAECDAELGA